jgi:glutamate 5-kinase
MEILERRLFNQEVKEKEKFITNRAVVKIGSSTITGNKETLDLAFMDNIARQVSELFRSGVKVWVVTSGAVEDGKWQVPDYDGSELKKREAASIGQLDLMTKWRDALFVKHHTPVSMHLLTEHDTKLPQTRKLLSSVVDYSVPVINANDSVNSYEIKELAISADNDRLSGYVTEAIDADLLFLLTDVDGVKDKNGRVIKTIYADRTPKENIIFSAKSKAGTGGMESKHNVAMNLAGKNIKVIVGNGREDNILLRGARGESIGTSYLKNRQVTQEVL